MIKKLKELKEDISELDKNKKLLDLKKAEYEASIKPLLDEKVRLSESITSLKSDLSTLALEEYDKTGEKSFLGGLKIRKVNSVSYDAAKALDFAKEKNMFLLLDTKAFEKVAPGLGLSWVKATPKNTITFPKEITI